MTLRIHSNDFSTFAGFHYNVEDKNEQLDKYIKLFLTTNDLKYFQIRLAYCTTADTIAYIVHKVDMVYFLSIYPFTRLYLYV